MAETLEFGDWLNEGFDDWMRAGANSIGQGLSRGLDVVDAISSKIDQIADSAPEIQREILQAHKDMHQQPELQEIMQNKASVLDLARKLAAIDPKKLEAEGKVTISGH